MEGILRTLRWTVAIRALLAMAIGGACLFRPWSTIEWLVLCFGAYAVVEGILILAAGAVLRWWTLLLQSLVSIALGVAALARPGDLAAVAVVVLGGWGVLMGTLQLAAARQLRELLAGEWMFALGGGVTVLAGATLVSQPSSAIAGLMWLLGSWALVTAVVMLGVTWRLTRTTVRI